MWINIPSLADVLLEAGLSMPAAQGEARDGRELRRQGWQQKELAALMLLSCVALMGGARTAQEILIWAGLGTEPGAKKNRKQPAGAQWLPWLGIRNERKVKTALENGVLERVDRRRLQQAVTEWTETVLEYFQLFEGDGSEDEMPGEEDAPVLEALCLRLNAFLDRLIGPATGPAEDRNQAPEFESLLAGLALTGYIESDVLNRIQAEREFLKAESPSIAGVPMAPPSGRRWQQRLAA